MPRNPRPPCPFTETPNEECYVSRMDSRTIERAIYYCGGKYEQCEIYRILLKGRQQESRRAGESGSKIEPVRGAENQE